MTESPNQAHFYFSKMPEGATEEFGGVTLAVINFLDHHKRRNGTVDLTDEEIASAINRHKGSVQRALREMERWGMVARPKLRGRRVIAYAPERKRRPILTEVEVAAIEREKARKRAYSALSAPSACAEGNERSRPSERAHALGALSACAHPPDPPIRRQTIPEQDRLVPSHLAPAEAPACEASAGTGRDGVLDSGGGGESLPLTAGEMAALEWTARLPGKAGQVAAKHLELARRGKAVTYPDRPAAPVAPAPPPLPASAASPAGATEVPPTVKARLARVRPDERFPLAEARMLADDDPQAAARMIASRFRDPTGKTIGRIARAMRDWGIDLVMGMAKEADAEGENPAHLLAWKIGREQLYRNQQKQGA